jgi:hypothetical protein
MSSEARLAKAPFEIYTLAHVSRMGGQAAATLRELANGLETFADESVRLPSHDRRHENSPGAERGSDDAEKDAPLKVTLAGS